MTSGKHSRKALSAQRVETNGPLPEGMALPAPDPGELGGNLVIASVAAAPDYASLSFSRFFSDGSPVVSCGEVPRRFRGRCDFAVTAGGEQIPVQYAAVEAGRLLSRTEPGDLFAPGRLDATEEEPLLVVSGFLRAIGLDRAYREGTASAYARRLREDCVFLGISRRAASSLAAPVIVRLMPSERVSPALAAVSNAGRLGEFPRDAKEREPELIPGAAMPLPPDSVWLDGEGAPLTCTLLEFVRRLPLPEQRSCLTPEGLPTRQLLLSFYRTQLAACYGPRSLGLFSGNGFRNGAEPLARGLLALLPLASAVERAGCRGIVSLVAEALDYAIACLAAGVPLPEALRQGSLTVSSVAQLWLFHAACSGSAERAAFHAYAGTLSEMLARRSGRRAKLALAFQVYNDFMSWLQESVPPRMSRFYGG